MAHLSNLDHIYPHEQQTNVFAFEVHLLDGSIRFIEHAGHILSDGSVRKTQGKHYVDDGHGEGIGEGDRTQGKKSKE